MSIDMYLSESRSQANGAKTMCQQQSSSYELLQNAVTKFTSTGDQLAGDAYDSARSFFSSVIRPLAQGGDMLSEAVGEACQKFPDDYVAQVCEESLKESELREKIARIERQMDSLRELQETIDSSVLPSTFKAALRVSNTLMMNCYQDACNELKLKLFKLEMFNAISPSIFSEISALRSLVEQGLAQADSSWNAKTGRFDVPARMPWAEGITERLNNKAFEKKYGLERPKEMPEKEYQEYITALRAQEDVLKKEDGWDESAFGAYIGHIKEDLEKGYINEDGEKALERLKTINENTRKVGSDVYTKMFEAYGLVDGKIPNGKEQEVHHKRLELLMKQMGGEINPATGMLVLNGIHKFSDDLAPHDKFYAVLRNSVIEAYPTEKGLNADNLGHKIHLFRSYIGKQNIDYIRNNFKGKNDYEKLQAYIDEHGLELDYSTGANYHNRYNGEFTYPKNMKVQLPQKNTYGKKSPYNDARMAEFIIDLESGEFVSEWNVYDAKGDGKYDFSHKLNSSQYEAIANTESFNYGYPRGQNKDVPKDDKTHDSLDVNHPDDSKARDKATNVWNYEKGFNSGGGYADIVKKEGDYDCWNEVTKNLSEAEKQEEYRSFVKYCRNNDNNRGFAEYYKKK